MSSSLTNVIHYDSTIEKTLASIASYLDNEYQLSKRTIATLLLQDDEEIHQMINKREKQNYQEILGIITQTKNSYQEPLEYVLAVQRQVESSQIARQVMENISPAKTGLGERISRLTMQPLTGIPILLIVLYFGLYKFVGGFGAGTLVNFLENHIFGTIVNPWVNHIVNQYIPWVPVQELLAKDYGIITLGVRYAISIILPIVGTFFIAFSIIEDSGYLPRLALLVDRVFKVIGLNGRAVIPMTLGFGCDTMATMVSRTLETKRERVIATLLLSLAIPCSAQLGVIVAILSGRPLALAVWVVFMLLVFMLVGYLTARLMPGERPSFYMELPPLRLPNWKNVLTKTYTRMQWYLIEVLPLFILASVLIWLGNITGAFPKIIDWLIPIVNWIGLPDKTAQAFLFGFFRRDFGAAGLYDLQRSGALNSTQLVVAAATLTLFVPCIAQFTMMIKERGLKTATAIASFIFPFAFISGFVLNWLINFLGVRL